ncbi:hypothetical protein PanWU01x14_251460 [Parasponia andersonii]|uniref:Uncharacterized protein n=1 Tax=Parasponia andersonii TaxID=3476 RepID=A0A2P5BCI1_PARAD|nr:hypothetical protein PanWU01x14_251460 [Parasponia andersonii]
MVSDFGGSWRSVTALKRCNEASQQSSWLDSSPASFSSFGWHSAESELETRERERERGREDHISGGGSSYQARKHLRPTTSTGALKEGRTSKVFNEISKSGIVIVVVFNPPKPLLPTLSSKAKLSIGWAIIKVVKAEIGDPRNFLVRVHKLLCLSLSEAFLAPRCYSSINISSMIFGPW